MNEADYKISIAVLENKMDLVCKKLDTLNGKLETFPVYKDRVNLHTKQIDEITKDVSKLTTTLFSIKGKFYAISVLIGIGSSVISGTIVYGVTRMILGG